MRPRPGLVLFLLAAVAGLFFTGWSTLDFVQHLDRQTHALHCSFIPGLSAPSADTESGCHVALMSPYSSWFRGLVWGGVPAALAGMGVFGFLVFRGASIALTGKQDDPRATLFLFGATAVPVATSIVYGGIAIVALDALCKLCLGIYASSALAAVGAGWLWWSSRSAALADAPRVDGLGWALGVGEGVAFVAVPLAVYIGMSPDFSGYVGTCGELVAPEDRGGVLIDLDGNQAGIPAVELLDPLCPSCKGFEDRLTRSGLGAQLDRKVALFPLDNACNWNVSYAVHPGACTINEAMLCAGERADDVLAWAFVNQVDVRTRAKDDPKAAESMVLAAFPDLKGCVGSEKARQRLNRSLKWAVANQVQVLTPQLFVKGRKLCDEDVDLGLDWSLARLIEEVR